MNTVFRLVDPVLDRNMHIFKVTVRNMHIFKVTVFIKWAKYE